MRTTQAFLKAKLIIRSGEQNLTTDEVYNDQKFRQHWANRYAPKVIDRKCFTQNGVIFRQRYRVAVTTALAGSVSRTSGSSGGAGSAGTNTGPIRPGAYGRPAPRFVETCWPFLYAVSPIPSPVPSEPDPCRIGNPKAISTADRAA